MAAAFLRREPALGTDHDGERGVVQVAGGGAPARIGQPAHPVETAGRQSRPSATGGSTVGAQAAPHCLVASRTTRRSFSPWAVPEARGHAAVRAVSSGTMRADAELHRLLRHPGEPLAIAGRHQPASARGCAGLRARPTGSRPSTPSRPAPAGRFRSAPRHPGLPPLRPPALVGLGDDAPRSGPGLPACPPPRCPAAPALSSGRAEGREALARGDPPPARVHRLLYQIEYSAAAGPDGTPGPRSCSMPEKIASPPGARAAAIDGSSAVLAVRRMLERIRSAGPASGASIPASPSRNSTRSATPLRVGVADAPPGWPRDRSRCRWRATHPA